MHDLLYKTIRILRSQNNNCVSGVELGFRQQICQNRELVDRLLLELRRLDLPDLAPDEIASRVRSQYEGYLAMSDSDSGCKPLVALIAACMGVFCTLLGGKEIPLGFTETGDLSFRLEFEQSSEFLHAFSILYPLALLNELSRDQRLDQRLVQVLDLAGRYFNRSFNLNSSQDDLLDAFSEFFPMEVINTFVNFLHPNSEHITNSLHKVLILEDDRALAEVFCDMLSSFGYVVYTAFDGVQGLKHVERESFDLIISDIQMPNLDGLSFLGVLRNLKPSIPVIITTGYTGIWEAREIMDLGAVAYLPKPFTMQDLISSVDRVVHREAI